MTQQHFSKQAQKLPIQKYNRLKLLLLVLKRISFKIQGVSFNLTIQFNFVHMVPIHNNSWLKALFFFNYVEL